MSGGGNRSGVIRNGYTNSGSATDLNKIADRIFAIDEVIEQVTDGLRRASAEGNNEMYNRLQKEIKKLEDERKKLAKFFE